MNEEYNMIRFRCIRCRAINCIDDTQEGKETKCPYCGKITPVPFKDDYSNTIPDKKIREKNVLEVKRSILSPVLDWFEKEIVFDELSVFIMSFSLVLLLLTNSLLREQLYKLYLIFRDKMRNEGVSILLILYLMLLPMLFLAGLVLSAVHVFIKRTKTEFEKTCMFFFGIVTTFLVGVGGSVYLLVYAYISNWWLLLIIFPLWNLACSILLFFRVQYSSDYDGITDENAGLSETLVAGVVSVVVFAAGQYLFKLHWIITLSMCVGYASSFSKSWKRVFVPKGIENRFCELEEEN